MSESTGWIWKGGISGGSDMPRELSGHWVVRAIEGCAPSMLKKGFKAI
jgi:hypothetical protein